MIRTILGLLLCMAAATPALAKEYRALRFDSRVEVQPGGDLTVIETVVFQFEEGTFREVFRTIPTRRTDGIEFVSATLDGVALAQGDAAGQVEVRRQNGLRVTWHFPPTSGTTHTFELTYVAHGVVRQDGRGELLEWMPLPREHRYRVDASRVEIILPAEPLRPASIREDNVDGELTVDRNGLTTTIVATALRRNGRFTVAIPFARGAILDGPPMWQARQAAHREHLPFWLSVSGLLVAGWVVLLFAMRQSADRPPHERHMEWTSLIPPEPIAPAIAGALVSNGRPQLEQAMATIFSLADRGIVTIREDPQRRLGQRNFVVQRTRAGEHLSVHEEAALDIIFAKASGAEASVTIAKARSYLTRHWSRFKNALLGELADGGLTDAARIAYRRRYVVTGVVLLGLAGVAFGASLLLLAAYGGYPMLVPLALAVGSVASFIFMSAHTPLSNEGVRRAEPWRAYKKHLSDPQGIETRWGSSGPAEARILPYAVALGLASAWSKFMKKGKVQTPAWFHAASEADAVPAFAVFIATSGAGAHGGGAAGGGSVAGGGARRARGNSARSKGDQRIDRRPGPGDRSKPRSGRAED
jgi:hypothetical protein